MKIQVQLTRPDSSSLQLQIWPDQAKSRRDLSRSNQILTRSIEIRPDFDEICRNPARFWPDPSRSLSPTSRSPHWDPSVLTRNKSPLARIETNLTYGFWRLAVGQLLCHSNLVSRFRVGHKPNLDWPWIALTPPNSKALSSHSFFVGFTHVSEIPHWIMIRTMSS